MIKNSEENVKIKLRLMETDFTDLTTECYPRRENWLPLGRSYACLCGLAVNQTLVVYTKTETPNLHLTIDNVYRRQTYCNAAVLKIGNHSPAVKEAERREGKPKRQPKLLQQLCEDAIDEGAFPHQETIKEEERKWPFYAYPQLIKLVYTRGGKNVTVCQP